MASLIATLPVQLACQLIHAGNYSPDNFTLAVDAPFQKELPLLPDGWTVFPDIGMAYKYFDNSLPWNTARKFCIAHESNLIEIDSFKKINYAYGLKNNLHTVSVWIGTHRLFGDGDWISLKTGLPVGVIPWAPTGTGAETAGCDCLAIWYDGRGIGAIPCTVKRHIICEIPLADYKTENRALGKNDPIPT